MVHLIEVIGFSTPKSDPTFPGSVICFPINAPGMGRFKLFNLVGYS